MAFSKVCNFISLLVLCALTLSLFKTKQLFLILKFIYFTFWDSLDIYSPLSIFTDVDGSKQCLPKFALIWKILIIGFRIIVNNNFRVQLK